MTFKHHQHFSLLLPILVLSSVCTSAQAYDRIDPEVRAIVNQIKPERIEATIRKLVSFGTRNTLSDQSNPDRGIGAARDWIAKQLEQVAQTSSGRMTVVQQSFVQPVAPRIPNPVRLTNIVATLHGSLPDQQQRVFVVSGHYDSMCSDPTDGVHDAPGANDDASGAAAVIELARVMAPQTFRGTIVFVCVAGEEQGLLGSTYFAESAKSERMPISAMFTDDIIGSSLGGNGIHDANEVRVFSEGIPSDETEAQAKVRRSVGGENDGPSRQLARFIQECAKDYVKGMSVSLVYRRDRYLRGGDHIPFLERGYPAVRFTEPNENYLHQHQNVRIDKDVQYGDLPEFVDFKYVARVAQVNAAALAVLALGPAQPAGATIVTSRLTNDTELRWNSSSDDSVTGYEVVWRATSQSNWTHQLKLGKVTTCVVPGISKDNYLFGVRSVDAKGHRSVVVYPKPGR